jgi:large conductance mechanosensitive channel
MSFVREFKEFALKGSVVDLAVGVIIGAGFNKIVDSLVNDLVMPVVGRFTGGLEFSNYFTPLGPVPPGLPHTLDAMKKAGVPVIAWGNFGNVVLNFAILAFIVFLMVRQINRLRRQEPAAAAPPENTLLLREIRDSLKK